MRWRRRPAVGAAVGAAPAAALLFAAAAGVARGDPGAAGEQPEPELTAPQGEAGEPSSAGPDDSGMDNPSPEEFDSVEWTAYKIGGKELVRFELIGDQLIKFIDGVRRVGSAKDGTLDESGVVRSLEYEQHHIAEFHQLRDQSGASVRASYEVAMDVLRLADRAAPRVTHNVLRPEWLPGGKGDVVVLDNQTWLEYVMDDNVNAFVRFVTPTCGECQGMEQYWKELAQQYKGQHDILIADIDGEQWEDLAGEHGVRGYPSFLFFTTAQKAAPFRYSKSKGWSGMPKFIEAHRDTSHHSHRKTKNAARSARVRHLKKRGDERAKVRANKRKLKQERRGALHQARLKRQESRDEL